MINNKISKEFFIFCLIGLALLVIDFGVYSILSKIGIKIWISKSIAYILGTLTSFYLNRLLTFNKKYKHSMFAKFVILYSFSFFCNVGINSILLIYTKIFIFSYTVALAIAVIINFLGQKFWVFK